MMFITPMIDILIIVVIATSFMQVLSRKMIDRKKMKAQQKVAKEKSKRIKDLMKSQNPNDKQQAERLQKEMFEDMGAQMQGSMRLLIFSMAIYIPLYAFIGWAYGEAVIQLPFPVPWLGGEEGLIKFFTETNWFGWYILIALITSAILNIGISVYGKIRAREND